MNKSFVGLLALGGIVYYLFNQKNKTKKSEGANEIKTEKENVVTETNVRSDDDI